MDLLFDFFEQPLSLKIKQPLLDDQLGLLLSHLITSYQLNCQP